MSEVLHIFPDILRGGREKRFIRHYAQEIKDSKIRDFFSAVGPGAIVGGGLAVSVPAVFEVADHPLSETHWIAWGVITFLSGIAINAENSRRIGREDRILREEELNWHKEHMPSEMPRREVLSTLTNN